MDWVKELLFSPYLLLKIQLLEIRIDNVNFCAFFPLNAFSVLRTAKARIDDA